MANEAKLARQAHLAEAGKRAALGVGQRSAAVGGDQRKRDREVRAGLVHAHAAGDVHEHVGRGERWTAVPGEDREHHRRPVALDPGGHAPRRHDLRGRHQRLHLNQKRAGALHRTEHARPRGIGRFTDKPR